MTIFPLPLSQLLGHWGAYVVFLLIGISFGFVLEMSGFGNSKKLAAQFYFKDMIVLKVMFGAIVVAMVLIFAQGHVRGHCRGHGADLRGHGRWPVGLQPALG